MEQELRQELEEFKQRTAALQAWLSGLQDSCPEGAEASDTRGAVRVRLASDGLPRDIVVVPDWSRRCGPGSLGTAVVEAARHAARDLMAAWSRNLPSGPWSTRPKSGALGEVPVIRPDSHPPACPQERTDQPVVQRPVDQIVEEAITALGSVRDSEIEVRQEVQVSGSDPARHVVLTLTHGSLNSCDVEARWAERASTVQINRAIHEALEGARSALARVSVAAQTEAERMQLDALLGEALALLTYPKRIDHA